MLLARRRRSAPPGSTRPKRRHGGLWRCRLCEAFVQVRSVGREAIGPMEREAQEQAQKVLGAIGLVSPRQFMALASLWTGLSTATGVHFEPVDAEEWKAWMHRQKSRPNATEPLPDRPLWWKRLQFLSFREVCRKGGAWDQASRGQMRGWLDLIDPDAPEEGYFPDGTEARYFALDALGLVYREEGDQEEGTREVLAAARRLTAALPTMSDGRKEADDDAT